MCLAIGLRTVMEGVVFLGVVALLQWARRLVTVAARAVGPRRALLGIGFFGIAMGATACSGGGAPPPVACGTGTPSGSLTDIPPNFTVGTGTTSTTIAFKSSTCPSVVGQQVTFTVTLTPDPTANVAPTGMVAVGVNNGQGNVPFTGCDSLPLTAATDGTNNFTTTCTTAFTTADSGINVAAGYSGDGVFAPNGATLVQTVNKASTTTAVSSSSPDPSVFGEPLSFTAAVTTNSPGAGTPTGTVSFSDNNGNPVTCTGGPPALDSNGTASCTTSTLPAGTTAVTGSYQADANFAGSTSAALPREVNKASTATVVSSSSLSPSVFGQPVTFTTTVAAVAPGAGTPTGTVTFSDSNGDLVTCTDGPPALDSNGTTTCTTSTLPAGAPSITASYQGDANFLGGTSAAFAQNVNQASTTTVVSSSSLSPSAFGQPVTFTTTVAAVAPGAGTPTGTVAFSDGANPVACTGGPPALDSNGIATCTTSALPAGAPSVTATYQGDTNFSATSTSAAFSQTVTQASTTTALSSSANPSVFGQPVTVTATVAPVAPGAGTPTGNVVFTVDGAAQPAAALSGGQATFTTAAPPSLGGHTVTATYGGDTNFSASPPSDTFSQTVNQASTTTALSSSANPSVFGQPVTVTATVVPVAPGAGTPTGNVVFTVDGAAQPAAALSGGQATFTTAAPPSLGAHTITATYGGDTNFSASPPSDTFSQTVNQASTTTALSPLDHRDLRRRHQLHRLAALGHPHPDGEPGLDHHDAVFVGQPLGLRPGREFQGERRSRHRRGHGDLQHRRHTGTASDP